MMSLLLVLLFILAYRSFCLQLIEQTGLKPLWVKEQYAFLPIVYMGLVGIFFVTFHHAKGENPPLALFAFVALICAIHVPGFAYGIGRVKEFVAKSGVVVSQPTLGMSWRFIATVTGILGMPVILALLMKAIPFDDYRLTSIDAVMTAVIVSLLAVSRSKQ